LKSFQQSMFHREERKKMTTKGTKLKHFDRFERAHSNSCPHTLLTTCPSQHTQQIEKREKRKEKEKKKKFKKENRKYIWMGPITRSTRDWLRTCFASRATEKCVPRHIQRLVELHLHHRQLEVHVVDRLVGIPSTAGHKCWPVSMTNNKEEEKERERERGKESGTEGKISHRHHQVFVPFVNEREREG